MTTALIVALGLALQELDGIPAQAAPVGQDFTLNAGDLKFILKQIKIAEAHATREGPNGEPVAGQPLFGSGPNQIASPLLPYGLRTVDGTYNNGQAGQSTFGAAHQVFPRITAPEFRGAEDARPFGPAGATSYAQKSGNVVDSQPRVISNLVSDQTAGNPAAVAAAGRPHRNIEQHPSAVPCSSPGVPAGCTPPGETLLIPNVTTDVGLSSPYNSWFALFGQFFDHGVDSTRKGGNGTVFVPLKDDDPLIAGPDRIRGNADDLPPPMRFMVLTRATNQPGPDGVLGTADDIQDASNTDTSWVDQSQTYASHSSHQVFLRHYENNADGKLVATGTLLEDAAGGMATWATVKAQAARMLGIRLTDPDVLNIPMVAADEYGRFLRGRNGYAQLVTASGLVEGNPAAPVAVPADVIRINVAFLDDIAHNAVPGAGKVPDSDTTVTGVRGHQPAGTYDDEMLDAHFIAGDGRANENIGLTAVHQVFHSEHNRLVEYVKDLITKQNIDVNEWKLAAGAGGWNGERLFQAARFVTEMEYQHIVFEDFARKIQPRINPFNAFTQSDTAIDPQVKAEFAHAVYRFGHSMLTDTVSRTLGDGTKKDVPLLDAFINPPLYYDNGQGGRLTPKQAAGAIAMGMADQTGNELDEFVTEALRNNLLGLPLDLATLNLTRARETGVPSLNNFRKKVHRATNDSALQPYSSWVDFGLSLKHETSVINFMAAYGKHPSIVNAPTVEAKRAAAKRIFDNDPALDPATPEDAYEFVHSSVDPTPDGNGDDWTNTAAGVSRTGLDDVDLWIGGLAESQNLFGGLLGSTFNYVFERQMTDLQDGDRLYYLSRTPGLNLRSQLEGNSFAELVMRNTDASALKADVFATADCEFELANLGTSGAITDDPASECDETKVLIRMPDGTIRYRQSNSIDRPGLNAQSTFNGTARDDRMWGGIDNDTFWGNAGNDRIEGNDGNDTALGGEGDDIITDTAGDDIHKGGPGDDAIDAGPGADIIHGGDGKDFVNGGLNGNTTFAGQGNDFVIAGDGPDTTFGGGGDDWQEGGNANDLLQGDSGAPFFDDLDQPGHDVLIGDSGEDDYDAEGGDDIMVAGPGIERNHGAFGFDWSTHVRDPFPADSDLTIVIGPPAPVQLADRYLLVEGLSGWDKDDILKGDDNVPSLPDLELGGAAGLNSLNAAGIARVNGLAALLPPGTQSWGAGNIILGGAGSDRIEGRGADDIIDGDKYLNVRLSVRTNPADPATEYRTATSLTELQADVFAGRIKPGNIVIVREILSNPGAGDVDTAVFSGARADYDITVNADSVTVAHVRNRPSGTTGQGAPKGDGVDTLRNIEKLHFSDQVVTLSAPDAPTIRTATAGNGEATVRWDPPANVGGAAITGYDVLTFTGTGEGPIKVTSAPATATRITVTGLAKGDSFFFRVVARNAIGASAPSLASNTVTLARSAPDAPAIGAVTGSNGSAVVNWTAPASDGGSPITGYTVQVFQGRTTTQVKTVSTAGTATSVTVTGLTNGQSYTFRVVATNAIGTSPQSDRSATLSLATVPDAPRMRDASPGAAGGASTASVRWRAPQSDGGSPITGYLVQALPIAAGGSTQAPFVSPLLAGNATTYEFALPPGDYRFRIIAVNAMGESQPSADSNQVTAR